jgi:Tol biopolymer transport system component
MNDLERELIAMLNEDARTAPQPAGVPAGVVHRVRSRQVSTVLISCMAVLALAVLSLAGLHAVRNVTEPATTPKPTPHIVRLTGNGPIDVIAGAFGDARNEVVAVSTSTGKSTQTIGPGQTVAISWSPNGTQLAYATFRGVFVLTPATGVTRFLGACSACVAGIAWSPNGRYIAVANVHHLQLWSPDGGRTKTIATLPSGYPSWPSWSPDSNRLVFVVPGDHLDSGMHVVNADGSHLTTLIGPLPDRALESPSWSPDGSQIAYLEGAILRSGPSGSAGTSGLPCAPGFCRITYSVMLIHPDGSNPIRLRAAGGTADGDFVPGLGWSPDGTSLALLIPGPTTAGVLTGTLPPGSGLYAMNRDGSDLRLLDRNAWGPPAWQPIP